MADLDSESLAPASSPPSLPFDPDPVTPTDPPASTPALASPDTPYPYAVPGARRDSEMEHLQTPAGPQVHDGTKKGDAESGKGSGRRMRGLTIVGMEDVDPAEEGVGLGFGDVEASDVVLGEDSKMAQPQLDVASSGHPGKQGDGPAAASIPLKSRSATPDAVSEGFPDQSTLRRMHARLAELTSVPSEGAVQELSQMVKALLTPSMNTLPFLQQQIEAQSETIKTLQAQAKLSHKMVKIERDRHAAERQSWRITLTALTHQRENEIATGSRSRGMLDVDMGYHEELEAANKRLEMENRLMGPRLADTQLQVDRLVAELRHLRSHVVLSTDPFTVPAAATWFAGPVTAPVAPSTPLQVANDPFIAPPAPLSRSPVKPSHHSALTRSSAGAAPLGDARTEHLLLAARKVRAMRQANPDSTVGRLTMEELRKNGIKGPEGGLGYKEGYPGVIVSGDEFEADQGRTGGVGRGVDEEGESEIEEKAFGFGSYEPVQMREPGSSGGSKARRASWSGKRNRGTTATPIARSRAHKNGDADEEGPTRRVPATAGGAGKARKGKAPVTPSSKRTGPRQAPHTTPGGNFNDLLRAAELATRPSTPTREGPRGHVTGMGMGMPASRGMHTHSLSHGHGPGYMSATRSTTRRGREADDDVDMDGLGDGDGSPTRKARRIGSLGGTQADLHPQPHSRVVSGGSTTSTGNGATAQKSALDLLLQASQLDSGTTGSDADANAGPRVNVHADRSGGQLPGSGGLEPAFEIRNQANEASRSSSAAPEGDEDNMTPRAVTRPTSAGSSATEGAAVQAGTGKGKGKGLSRPGRPAPIDVPSTAQGTPTSGAHNPPQTLGTATSAPHAQALRQGTPLLSAPGSVHARANAGNGTASAGTAGSLHTPARPWTHAGGSMPDSSPFEDTARGPGGDAIDPVNYHFHQIQTQAQQQQQQTPRTVANAANTHAPSRGSQTPANGYGNGNGAVKTPMSARPAGMGGAGGQAGVLAFDSPTGAPVPGLGKYAHLTSSMPARRVRSPYLKWTVEEDELLARAVAIHGEKWDLVSKGVPTRSYHQVRQRWLRKTGAFDKKAPTPSATPSQPAPVQMLSHGNGANGHYDESATGQAPMHAGGKTVAPSLINGLAYSGRKGSAGNSRNGSNGSGSGSQEGDDEQEEGAMQRSNSPTPAPGAKAGRGRKGSLSLV